MKKFDKAAMQEELDEGETPVKAKKIAMGKMQDEAEPEDMGSALSPKMRGMKKVPVKAVIVATVKPVKAPLIKGGKPLPPLPADPKSKRLGSALSKMMSK